MLRTTKKDNTSCEYQIVGARSQASNADIASIFLCNYDDDSKLTYRLGEICVRDHYGNGTSNGFGNMYFRTNSNATTSSNIQTQMCILHNGNVGIRTVNPECDLHVYGTIKANAIDYETYTSKEPFLQTILTPKKIDTIETYNRVCSWIFDATISQTRVPTAMLIHSHLEPTIQSEISHSNFKYDIRIYDSSHRNILGEMTFSNNIPCTQLIPLSNFTPSNRSIIEMHIRKGQKGSFVDIENLLFSY